MIIDVGASRTACRGDVCLVYRYDTATDQHLVQYDAIWPLRQGKVYYYANIEELVSILKEVAHPGDTALFVHSLEHMDCPFTVLRTLYNVGIGAVHIYVPNAETVKVNPADYRDHTHVYSWTLASLRNLLHRALPGYFVGVEEFMKKMDIHAWAVSP